MFKFLKNAFGKKEICLNFDEIENHLGSSKKKNDVLKIFDDILGIKEKIKANLQGLENVRLDQKVEDKLRNMVKGNIPAFMQAVNKFLDKIQIPEKTNSLEIMGFINNTESELESFNKKTYKNFHIMSNLIGKELENVVKEINRLNGALGGLKKFSNFFEEEDNVREKIAQIRRYMETKDERKNMLENRKKEKENLIKENDENERKIKLLYLSPKLTKLKNHKKQLKEFHADMLAFRNLLIDLFSIFQKGLKKYNNLCYIKLVDDYINNPVEALLKDNDFEILKHLDEIKKLIEQNKIEIKDDKKNKVVEKISRLERKDLEEFRKQHRELVDKQKEVKEKIEQNTIEDDILVLKEKVEENKIKVKDIENKINSFKELDLEKEIGKIEGKLKSLLDNEVKVECSWLTGTGPEA